MKQIMTVVWRLSIVAVVCLCTAGSYVRAREADQVIPLWPDVQPGPAIETGEEQDFTKPTDRLVGGRPLIKLGNVSVPQAHVYLAPAEHRTGAAVVICPGGGYHILAWDLEGTEVAEWLNSVGVTAVVLKYRVPTGKLDPKWLGPVQDAQRTVSLVRTHADRWGVDAEKIGVLGFSAGGDTAARIALASQRWYEARDQIDQAACHVNASILIYPGYLLNDDRTGLRDDLKVTKDSPRMFLAHAWDDPVTPESSLQMATALKQNGVPVELHLYDAGGHGYGLRSVDDLPVTQWNLRCAEWMRRLEWAR